MDTTITSIESAVIEGYFVAIARGDHPYRVRRKAALMARSVPCGDLTPRRFTQWVSDNWARLPSDLKAQVKSARRRHAG